MIGAIITLIQGKLFAAGVINTPIQGKIFAAGAIITPIQGKQYAADNVNGWRDHYANPR